MITILANIRINSKKRLKHLKDSFSSFNQISDNWLINIRGKYRIQTMIFLQKNLGERATIFELLDDDLGWSTNCLTMLKSAKHNHIFVWVEDHVNISPQKYLNKVIKEGVLNKVDFLFTTWWRFGYKYQRFDKLGFLNKHKTVSIINLTKDKWLKFTTNKYRPYLIPMQGIFKKKLLIKIMQADQKMWPVKISYAFFKIIDILIKLGFKEEKQEIFKRINKYTGYSLRRYPRQTPFGIELDSSRTDILPLKYALPNKELFACIDDDGGVNNYSLISRGLYPPHKTNAITKKLPQN